MTSVDAELFALWIMASFLIAWILAFGPVLPMPHDDPKEDDDDDKDNGFKP